MIFEVFINGLIVMIEAAINGAVVVGIPVDGIAQLAKVCSYGSYVVGADLLLVFASCVLTWMGIKLSVGIFLFVWRLLPFT